MATTPNRIAANRANAQRSTGPKSPEGKARSSQNARKPPFNPDPFTVIRSEDRAEIANRIADAIATYQPINSQERDAVERIALAQHSIRRLYAIEAGYFTNCFTHGPMDPDLLSQLKSAYGAEVGQGQLDAYTLVFGFNCFNRQSNLATVILRFQVQAERLYRRAVEDFHRLFKLRDVLPPEKYEGPIEPIPEPKPYPKPPENTDPPPDPDSAEESPNEPNAEPEPAPTVIPRNPPATAAERLFPAIPPAGGTQKPRVTRSARKADSSLH